MKRAVGLSPGVLTQLPSPRPCTIASVPESTESLHGSSPPPSNPWMTAAQTLTPWRGPRPSALVAWLGIVVALCGILALAQYERSRAPDADPLAGDVLFEMQAKVRYGAEMLGSSTAGLPPLADYRALATTPGMAWRVASLLAALEPRDAQSRGDILPLVEKFDEELATLGSDAQAVHASVKTALHDPQQLTTQQRRLLTDQLGWFADVLMSHAAGSQNRYRLAAEREAYRIIWIGAGAFGLAILVLVVGGVLFAFKLVVHVNQYGELRIVMHQMYAPPAIYLEAVAIYLLLAFVLPVLAGFIPGAGDSIVLSVGLLTAASVAGVAWPFIRHRAPAEVASDVGLTRGGGVLLEIGAGIVGYVAAAPIFLVGVGLTYALLVLYLSLASKFGWDTEMSEGPVTPHPVVQWIAHGPVYAKIGVLLLASGFAPFFEETMFRGALLSGAARTIRLAPGILVMAFIFAAIHPQGWVAVPALMSLAIAFALIRIWRRGSLIASMTAHAIHNGFLVLLMILLLG